MLLGTRKFKTLMLGFFNSITPKALLILLAVLFARNPRVLTVLGFFFEITS